MEQATFDSIDNSVALLFENKGGRYVMNASGAGIVQVPIIILQEFSFIFRLSSTERSTKASTPSDAMDPQDLATSLRALSMNSTLEKFDAFVSRSVSSPYAHLLTFLKPNEVVWKPVAITAASANALTYPDGSSHMSIAGMSPYVSTSGETNLCNATDCPVGSVVHYKGFFLHDPRPGRLVQYNEDFGYSDPPPFLWAAYCRATDCFEALQTNERAAEIFIDNLRENLWEDPDNHDKQVVTAFLKYHAVTLKEVEGRMEFVPLRGRILSGVDPEVLNGMTSLTL